LPSAPESQMEQQLDSMLWCLRFQIRGKRAGRDWVVESGICVIDSDGVNEPLHRYLVKQLLAFATTISAQPERSAAAMTALWERTLTEVEAVVNSIINFPDEHWAYATCAMLMGNFANGSLAILNIALGNDEPNTVLAIDSHTLGVVAPEYYSTIKGDPDLPEGAATLRNRFALCCTPNSSVAGEMGIAPRSYWALQNALNFEFRGKTAREKKDLIKQWDDQLATRFREACICGDEAAGFVTPDELEAYLRQT